MTSPDPHCRLGRFRIKRSKSSRILLPFNMTTAMLMRARSMRDVNPAADLPGRDGASVGRHEASPGNGAGQHG